MGLPLQKKAAPRPPQQVKRPLIHHTQGEDLTVFASATFAARWYALTLDVALFTPLNVMLTLPFERLLERLQAFGHYGQYLLLSLMLMIIPLLVYFVAPTVIWGQTLGKRIVGVRVVRGNYRKDLTLGTVLMRETLGKLLSAVFLLGGFFMVLFTNRRQSLHDLLADTIVIGYRQR